MAYSDKQGKSKKGGKQWNKNLSEVRESIQIQVDENANLVVGDFLTELLTVMRTRIMSGLRDGDWIEDPERLYTDGGVFGEEVRVASDVKLQIALAIDVSKSTYFNGCATVMSRAVLAIDKTIRKAMQELPEGALSYRLFAFNRNTYTVTEKEVIQLDTRAPEGSVSTIHQWGTYFIRPDGGEAQTGLTIERVRELATAYNEMGVRWKYGYENNWYDTLITPLFEAIEAWEKAEGDPSAYRIDIILSDGELDNAADVKAATAVQERRNGKLTTFMLNFLPRDKWGHHTLPQRCYQYEASQQYLGQQIQQIISDALLEMS